jgi:hypothetical protein
MRRRLCRYTTGVVIVTVATIIFTAVITTATGTTAITGDTMSRRRGITGTATHRRGTIITPGTMHLANTAGAR